MNQAELISTKKVPSIRRLQVILKAMGLAYNPDTAYQADLIESISEVSRLMSVSKITASEAIKGMSDRADSPGIDDVCDRVELQATQLDRDAIALAHQLGQQTGMSILTLANIVAAQVVATGGVDCDRGRESYQQSGALLRSACGLSPLALLSVQLNLNSSWRQQPFQVQEEQSFA